MHGTARWESRNSRMEEYAIQMEAAYKKKTVKICLTFSDDRDGRNAKYFEDSLKKIYMKKFCMETFSWR